MDMSNTPNDKEDERIEYIVNRTIVKLKIAGLMKDEGKTAAKKTEDLLKNYSRLKLSNEQYAIKLCDKVDLALQSISTDYYADIITMYYFQGSSREEVAFHYNTSGTTISRNKKRLINQMAAVLFSTDLIYELFL